jgi:hypothetical protein
VRAVALALLIALTASATATAATVTHTGRGKWRVEVTGPGQFDFTLARAEFRLSHRDVVPHRAQLAASPGPSGLNAVIVAKLRLAPLRWSEVYVLAVNRRPAGSLAPDLASIPVSLAGRRLARAPALIERVNAFAAADAGMPPPKDLCTGTENPPAGAFDVRAQAGAALDYPPDAAVSQALAAVCGRPVDPAFAAAVRGGGQPVPTPTPPPGCPPCDPRMGRVCPANAAAVAIACVQQ